MMKNYLANLPSFFKRNEVAVDENVEDLRRLLLQRAAVGQEKYGITTMRDDLTERDWLQHALEEALDLAVYLRAAIRRLDNAPF